MSDVVVTLPPPPVPPVSERQETWEIGVCYARVNGKPLYCRGSQCRNAGHAWQMLQATRERENTGQPADEFCILHTVTEIIV